MMKEINDQYEKCMMGAFQKEGKSNEDLADFLKDSMEFVDRLNSIITIIGLNIEICGSWIWVTGNTKEAKDKLKECGFVWACKKLAWYWRKPEDKKKTRGTLSLDQIRERYGSKVFNGTQSRILSAVS